MDISRITEINPRLAWKNEALDFTPWLAANIEHLSEVLGIELELVDTEVAVTSYSADILARDVETDHRVLIENQLEKSDHGHLGQIMTYLAGLDAKVVVWIAPHFSPSHLSAMKWLNEHTPDDMAFFSVGLRVVRIGESPAAPIFEVRTRPDVWAREVSQKAANAESELTVLRARFWQKYLDHYPGRFKPSKASNIWINLNNEGSLVVSMYVAQNSCGLFVRGSHGGDLSLMDSFAQQYGKHLSNALGVTVDYNEKKGWLLFDSIAISVRDESRWPEAIEWLEARLRNYQTAISALPTA